MNIAIIGHEERKFTSTTKSQAQLAMSDIVCAHKANEIVIVSGRCHLGGIDVWAEELADALKIPKLIFPARHHGWDGEGGYKDRNIQIAMEADIIYVIVVANLPPGYSPEPWNRKGPCYHCAKRKTDTQRHVKSGACWTAWYGVEQLGKQARWIVI